MLASSVVAFTAIRWAGVAYLAYLGVRAFRPGQPQGLPGPPALAVPLARSARRGLIVGLANPKMVIFFLAFFPPSGATPRPASLAELVAVAGARWAVEDCFAEAKNETGLDHYQVRLYTAWYRHITLSMLAHAFLAVTARALRPPGPPPAGGNDSGEPAKKGCRRLWTNIQPAEGI